MIVFREQIGENLFLAIENPKEIQNHLRLAKNQDGNFQIKRKAKQADHQVKVLEAEEIVSTINS